MVTRWEDDRKMGGRQEDGRKTGRSEGGLTCRLGFFRLHLRGRHRPEDSPETGEDVINHNGNYGMLPNSDASGG